MLAKVLALCFVTVVAVESVRFSGETGKMVTDSNIDIKRNTDCSSFACLSNQVCIMETVFCKRDPCPPVATCVAKDGDICKYSPCQNGGKCSHNSHYGYVCTCPVGFIGVDCGIKFDN